MGTWGNFTAREERGTAQVQYTEDGVTASVTLRVAYADRNAIISDLLSNRRPWPKGNPGLVPLATSVGKVPDEAQYTADGTSESIIYAECLLNVGYTTLELAQPTVDSIEPTSEFITLDARCFRWGSPDGLWVSQEEAPGLLLRGFNFVRTWSDRTEPPHTDYVTLVGSVNNAPVTSSTLGFTFPTETLLYQPPNISWAPRIDGTTRFQLTVKGTYKPQGWNKYWRALSQSWVEMYVAGGGVYKSYPPADLTNVFDYGALP